MLISSIYLRNPWSKPAYTLLEPRIITRGGCNLYHFLDCSLPLHGSSVGRKWYVVRLLLYTVVSCKGFNKETFYRWEGEQCLVSSDLKYRDFTAAIQTTVPVVGAHTTGDDEQALRVIRVLDLLQHSVVRAKEGLFEVLLEQKTLQCAIRDSKQWRGLNDFYLVVISC